MSFSRFFTELTASATDTDFVGVFGTTAQTLSLSSDLGSLSSEAGEIVKWIRYKLGEPRVTVELDNLQIFSAFEEANIEYGSIINKSHAKSWLSNHLGNNRDFSTEDFTNKLPFQTLDYLKRLAQPFAQEANVGGRSNKRKAYITINSNAMDYDVMSDAIDNESGSSVSAYIASQGAGFIDVRDVWHNESPAIYRYYDPYSSSTLLGQEFGMESYNAGATFYMEPVWSDVLRAGMTETSDRVRRSNFTYHLYGSKIKILPTPQRSVKVWFDYTIEESPFGPSGTIGDNPSTTGVSSLANIPFSNLKYEDINSFGKAWIRQYTFAICLEILGRIRRRFSSIPIPNGEIQMDGNELVAEGIDMRDKLREELKTDLEGLSNTELMRGDAELAQSIQDQLSKVPMPIPFFFA